MISVLLLTFNRNAMLRKAVESFLSQTLKDKELILVDNGSTEQGPRGEDINFEYGNEMSKGHKEIAFWKSEKNNIREASQLALDFASGDICVIMHDDDFFSGPESLQKYQSFFDQNDFDVIYCTTKQVQGGKEIIYRPGPPNFSRLLKCDYFHFPGMAFRKDIIKATGWIEDDIRYQVDYDFKLRCFMNSRVGWMDDPVYTYVRHPGQENYKQTPENKRAENEIIFRRLGLDIPK